MSEREQFESKHQPEECFVYNTGYDEYRLREECHASHLEGTARRLADYNALYCGFQSGRESLRQADQQAQPVAARVVPAQESLPFRKVAWLAMDLPLGTELFTSPPAPQHERDQQAQPQARELSDEEIHQAFDPEDTHATDECYRNDPINREWLSRVRAVIAADRAIRPAAGMVGKSRKEFDAWFDAKSAQILLAPREAIARLIADHLFIEIDRLRAELEAYQKAVLEECGSELAESIELLAAAQEPSNGQG